MYVILSSQMGMDGAMRHLLSIHVLFEALLAQLTLLVAGQEELLRHFLDQR